MLSMNSKGISGCLSLIVLALFICLLGLGTNGYLAMRGGTSCATATVNKKHDIDHQPDRSNLRGEIKKHHLLFQNDWLFQATAMNNENVSPSDIKTEKLTLVKSDPPYFTCNAPKTGCTAWKNFYAYLYIGFIPNRRNPGLVHDPKNAQIMASHSAKGLELSDEQLHKQFIETDRILFVRNPYVRFLSSYFDWQSRGGSAEKEASFAKFTTMYETRDNTGFQAVLWDHIDPITTFCKWEKLGGYIVLRAEEQALWFDVLLDRYGLREKMIEYENKTDSRVFETLLDPSSPIVDFVPAIMGREPYPASLWNSTHHRDSAGRLLQYYNPNIAAKVTQLFLPDFVHFGYPLWDGYSATFRFV